MYIFSNNRCMELLCCSFGMLSALVIIGTWLHSLLNMAGLINGALQ